jgi:hypothetical protein
MGEVVALWRLDGGNATPHMTYSKKRPLADLHRRGVA